MSEVPGTSSESSEADRLEQSLDVERPEIDDYDGEEAHAPGSDRSVASSLEADPVDVEEQEQEVVLEDPGPGSTLEDE